MGKHKAKVQEVKPLPADGKTVGIPKPARPGHGLVPQLLRSPDQLRRGDFGVALAILALILGLYLLNLQARMYGDASGLLKLASRDTVQLRMHAAYLPALAFAQALLPGLGLLAVAKLFSAFCGAIGCAAIYLLGRTVGQTRRVSVLATLLAASTPALWFYSTTVEVHTFQFAAVAVGALVVFHAPWKRPVAASLLSGLALVAAYSAHETSVLLGPGWIALCMAAAARQGAHLSTSAVLSRVAPIIFLLGVAASGTLNFFLANQSGEALMESSMFFDYLGHDSFTQFLWSGAIVPLALLLPLALLGLQRSHLRKPLALLVLFPFAVLLWWRVPERGAYFLGCLPFLALLGAQGLDSLRMPSRVAAGALAIVVITAQAGAAAAWTGAFDSKMDPAVRVDLVRASTQGTGVVLVPLQLAPPITLELTDLEEVSLSPYLLFAMQNTVPHDQFAEDLVRLLIDTHGSRLLQDGIFIETHFDLARSRASSALILPYLQAFERALRDRFDLEEAASEEWKIARLLPKASRL